MSMTCEIESAQDESILCSQALQKVKLECFFREVTMSDISGRVQQVPGEPGAL